MKPVTNLSDIEKRILLAIVNLPTHAVFDDDIHVLLMGIGYTDLEDCLKALEALNSLVEKGYVYIQDSHWTEKSNYRGRSSLYYVGSSSAAEYKKALA